MEMHLYAYVHAHIALGILYKRYRYVGGQLSLNFALITIFGSMEELLQWINLRAIQHSSLPVRPMSDVLQRV